MPESLQHKLAGARRKWRLIAAASVFLLAIAALNSLALISFYTDRMLVLDSSGRYYWQMALFITLAFGLLALIAVPLRRRIADEMVAAEVEKKNPELGERLLSTIELSRSGGYGASSQMISALQSDTESATKDLSFSRAIPTSQVRKPALFSFVALGALGVHLLLAPEALGVWFRRIMNPEADIPLYARTQVWAAAQRKVIPRGENIVLTVKLAGRLVDESTLHYKFGGGNWAQAKLTKPETVGTAEGEFRKFVFKIPDAQQNVTFYATAADGRSNPHTVRVEDRPAVLSVHMSLDYPDYTGKPSESVTASSGNIVAPVGTRVVVTANANKPLGSAAAVRSEKTETPWAVYDDQARGEVVVSKDDSYTLRLKDRNGFVAEQAPVYTIRAQQDRAPEVQISRPGADIDGTPQSTVNLRVSASDDYGVQSTSIVYRIAKRTGSLPLPGARGSTQVTASAGWNLASLRLNPGDEVIYHAAAKDGDTVSGPNIGKSSEYRIRILSLAEMRERLDAQQAQEREALKQLLVRQKEAQKALEEARKTPANPDKLAQAQGAQRSVAQETADLARRMEQTSQQMRDNNLGSRQQMEQREAARQSLQSLGQKEMPKAADTIQRAQNQQATRSSDLTEAARQEQQIRDELERLVREQEPGSDLAQLADEAQRLAQEQQRLAEESDLAATQTENKAASELSAQERARMSELAKKQAQLNAQTKALEKQLQRAAQEAKQNGRQNAQDVSKAAQQMQQSGLQQQQADAQKSLQNASPQEASPQQSEAAKNLQELAKNLDEAVLKSDAKELEKRAEKLEQAGDELLKLYNEQRRVLQETQQNPGQAKSQELEQRERAIGEQAKKVEDMLRDAPAAQQTIQRAQQSVDSAAQKLGEFTPQQAVPPEQQAARDFLRASQEAQEAARSMREQQQAREMQQKVQQLAKEQRQLKQQTAQLDKSVKTGQMSAAEQQRAAELASKQQQLGQQGQDMLQDMPSTAFRWALGQANRRMENARQGLQQRNAGEQTQRQQENAAQTLERIARALGQQAQGQQQQQQAGGQQSGAQQQMAEGSGELQLAREMEAQIRQETAGIEQQRRRNPGRQPTAEQQRELNNLAQAQRETRRITENAAQRFRSEPDIARNIQRAAEEMDAVQDRLQQQDSGQETQGMQQRIVQSLDRAIRQSQQAMRQQRQQMAQQQQQQQGQGQQQQNQPGGNSPAQRSTAPLSNVQYGKLNKVDPKGRGFGNLSPRAMQSLREGRQERVPAEYRELVNQYYKALSERSVK